MSTISSTILAPKIEFRKVRRYCGHNDAIDGGKKGQIIYDYNVIIDGEHRVTLRRNYGGVGYDLVAATEPYHHPVYINRGSAIRISAKGIFDYQIRQLLKEDKIPTVFDCLRLIEEGRAKDEGEVAKRRSQAQDAETAEKLSVNYDEIARFGPIGLTVRLWQHNTCAAHFAVTYHLQIKKRMNCDDATAEFGECIMHSISSQGLIRR